ncbi:MAG: hypothetical protein A4E57_01500 [Syntrophorhabdaceae bacterium PtaU1.Bin034]|jgi:NMD protein affecting ribosome stability and mRNA decay|nr:MAG: hypothetical protein A4E57_01500 [Syntrophorhabdaceae bacterium PtaU1.Bin034]
MARLDRMIQPYIHDPYFVREKYQDPSVCTKCNLVFHDGIFEWLDTTPPSAQKMVCPACRRIEDSYEGGNVVLEGAFLKDHRSDVLNIIRNVEQLQKRKRPLERIMSILPTDERIEIKTTYEHLARRIGEAVNKAYKGELKLQYREAEKFIRVYWRRD